MQADLLATVRRDGGKVWIEGVKGFSPAEFASSVHGSQARILECLGEPLTYADLICYSGFAFRVGVSVDMCPSAGHPLCGYVCFENGSRALPWRTKVFAATPGGRPPDVQASLEASARAAIRESVDRGVPVHYGREEDGLIVGYADGGGRWWCVHPYHRWGAEPFWHDEVGGMAGGGWPWGIAVWTEPKAPEERAAERDLLLAALRQAVDMWETRDPIGAYLSGDAAYDRWLGWLRRVEAGEVADPRAGMQGNGWYLAVLGHCRPIASRWLAERADALDGEARPHLLAAAEHYAALGAGILRGLGSTWDLAPMPDRLAEWTRHMRQEQIQRLEAARERDAAAIAEIKAALPR